MWKVLFRNSGQIRHCDVFDIICCYTNPKKKEHKKFSILQIGKSSNSQTILEGGKATQRKGKYKGHLRNSKYIY